MGVALFTTALCLTVKHSVEQRVGHPARYHPSIEPVEAKYHAKSFKKYAAGFDNFWAALLWVQLLQQSSHQPIHEGRVSWEFTHVDTITELEPNFDLAYRFGATFLSVFKQDRLGAKLILEKWVARQPYFWRPNYLLGFHYFSELNDPERGAEYILKAARLEGAPSWISSLGVRVLSETGALAQALKLSLDLFPGIKDPEGRDRLRRRIRSLNYGLQKKGWETALKKFRAEKKAEPLVISDLKPYLHSEVRAIATLFEHKMEEELEELIREPFRFHYDPTSLTIQPSFDLRAAGLSSVGVERKATNPENKP